MYIKEQTKITKDGKVVVKETPAPVVIRDFIEQMEDRGYEMFVYAVKDLNAESPDQDDIDDYDMYGCIDYSNAYMEDDMINALEGYLIDFPPSERVNFAIRMMNTILSDAALPDNFSEEEDL